jgi:hypothetical protein
LRAINPISKTNWEGTGAEPDVKVPAAEAIAAAQKLAAEKLASKQVRVRKMDRLTGDPCVRLFPKRPNSIVKLTSPNAVGDRC